MKSCFKLQNLVGALLAIITITACRHAPFHSKQDKFQEINALYQKYSRQFPQVAGITVQKLQQQLQLLEQSVVLVDVRPANERAISMIPGAISIQEFEANLEHYRHSLVVAYCTIGFRSGKYAQKLQKQGVKIFNLEGSLLAWSHVQGELVDSSGLTNRVHIYNRRWQLIAEGYESVW